VSDHSLLHPFDHSNDEGQQAESVGPWRKVWRPGDEPGLRQFASIGDLALELGGVLPNVTVCYEAYGTLNEDRSNAVLVLHGFTGDSHAQGNAMPGHPEPGWWNGVIGSGLGIDTDELFVVVPNVLGGCQGTTGPGQPADDGIPYGSRWPVTTVRDMVAAEVGLADALGIDCWHSVVGVSLGGMRALEWAIGYPSRQERSVVIGCGAAASADQIAVQTIQMASIADDPEFHNGDYYGVGDGRGPVRGMAQARRLGHMTYRTEMELHRRFGNRPQEGEVPFSAVRNSGRYGVVSYLDYAAERLERRFDANSYLAINEAMNHHDIGRGRGGIAAAMKRITADMQIVGLDDDRLYPVRLQRELVFLSPQQRELALVFSIVGHDAFLIEDEAMNTIIRTHLKRKTV
jgi:homoserine O-acetyltransferase/O-succinyltransferase